MVRYIINQVRRFAEKREEEMRKHENWGLGFWKCVAMSWKIAARRARKSKNFMARCNAIRHWKEAMYMVNKIEARVGVGILVCLTLLILAGGCHTGRGLGTMVRGIGQDVEQLNDGYMEKNRRAR